MHTSSYALPNAHFVASVRGVNAVIYKTMTTISPFSSAFRLFHQILFLKSLISSFIGKWFSQKPHFLHTNLKTTHTISETLHTVFRLKQTKRHLFQNFRNHFQRFQTKNERFRNPVKSSFFNNQQAIPQKSTTNITESTTIITVDSTIITVVTNKSAKFNDTDLLFNSTTRKLNSADSLFNSVKFFRTNHTIHCPFRSMDCTSNHREKGYHECTH